MTVVANQAVEAKADPRPSAQSPAGIPRRRQPREMRAEWLAKYSGWLALTTQIGLVAVLCGIWQLAVGLGWVNSFFFGTPSEIVSTLWDWILDGTLFVNAFATFYEALTGLVIAVIFAVPVGIVIARSPFWAKVVDPFIDMANSMPRFALAPLFVLFFGLGQLTKIVLVVSVVFFVMLINTIAGVGAIDRNYIRLAQLVGVSRRHLFAKVILPASARWLLTGLRLSVPYAIAGAVVGEMIAANKGLGYLVVKYAGLLETSKVLAAVVVLALAGWGINKACSWLVGRSPWMN